MKTVEFSFDRSSIQNTGHSGLFQIQTLYTKVLEDYFLKIFNKKVTITLEFINISDTSKRSYLTYTDKNNILADFLKYTVNLKVLCKSNEESIFSFYIYDQNNCCGAMSVSDTYINSNYHNHKLAKLIQYLKEDICISQGVSLLTCTDVYWKSYTTDYGEVETLAPYMRNTKVLLATGWKVSKLFLNRGSSNVVGVFTKAIPHITNKVNKITMKITKIQDKLIEVKNVTIGADPELFFKSRETGKFVPSFYVMKGDKHNPVKITEEGHAISCDNVMAEYMIPPSKTAKEFVKHNTLVQEYLNEKIAKPNNLDLVVFPFAEFDENDLTSDKAQAFGCDPDFCVYTEGKPNKVGRPEKLARCAGGHLHMGYDDPNNLTNNYIIRALDLFISVPLVLMEPANRRKEMYGKAGAYRTTSYGVEYRSPSNYVFSSPELMEWAFNQVEKAIKFLNNGGSKYLNEDGGTVRECIDRQNKDYANYLIDRHKINIIKTKIIV